MYAERLDGQDNYTWATLTDEERLGLNQDSTSPYISHEVTHVWILPPEQMVNIMGLLRFSNTLLKYDREFPRVGNFPYGPRAIAFFTVRGPLDGIAFARHPEADLEKYSKAFGKLLDKTNKALSKCDYPVLTEPPVANQAVENLVAR